MSSFVRQSKYRHIYGHTSKDNQFFGIKITKSAADSNFCAVNPKFVAIITEGAGGGPFIVLPIQNYGRYQMSTNLVNGHTEKTICLAWSPFNDNLIASGSEDNKIMLWEIPDEGVKDNLSDPWLTLKGHQKRVVLLEWHPTAEYILASSGDDKSIIIWNVSEGEAVRQMNFKDFCLCMSWNLNGSLLAGTFKDKTLRVLDVRNEKVVQERLKFVEGSKPSKCVFLKDGRIFTTGFTRMSARLYALWNSKDLSTPLVEEEVDNSNGAVYIHYDPSNNVVFTIGKGDSQIKYYEVDENEPFVHYLSTASLTGSSRGFCWMPKRGLQVSTCEIARCYRLTEDKITQRCEVVGLIVPRKSDLFQEDIFPPCPSEEPALSSEEWLSGKDADPKTMSMKPLFDEQKASKGVVIKKSNKPMRSLSQKTPRSTGLSVRSDVSQQNGTAIPPGLNLEELAEDVKKLKATVRKVCRRLNTIEKQLGEVVADDGQEEEE